MTQQAIQQKVAVRIAMVGGGSGGHITPILAVAQQLKQLEPQSIISYIGQTGDGLADVPAADPHIDACYGVRAGKLRRYHGEGWRQLLDVPTIAKNLRDVLYVGIGFVQSLRLLRRLRPDVLFVKGGFVGVPVGLAAAALGIPYITHDSDAIPGLANRIIARWATLHTVALPKEVYQYPPATTLSVGVPVSQHFRPNTVQEVAELRHDLQLAPHQRLVLVTGGGLGAQRLNNAVLAVAPALLQAYPDLQIVHLAGRNLAEAVTQAYDAALPATDRPRVVVQGFANELYKYSAVAEVVVTRAGGNSLAEFAAQAKPCVVVPNPVLAGGHQLKNAQVLADREAVVLLDEATLQQDHEALAPPLRSLLNNPAAAQNLGERLQTVAQPDAAHRLAVVLLEQSRLTKNQNHHAIQTTQTP